MKARIIDIARLAQVSPGTVDRVIHNRGEVSEKTRDRVNEIIKELDYQPDILARSLAKKKDIHFYLLIPVSANENDFWYAPLKGVEKALNEIKHYGIRINKFFFNQFEVGSFKKEYEKLLGENPDAVLFAPVFEEESRLFLDRLKEAGIPVVLINSFIDRINGAGFIGQDAVQSGYLAGKLLTYGWQEEGHILLLNISSRKDNYNHILRRERGFRKFFTENYPGKFTISTIESMQSTSEELNSKLKKEFSLHRIKGIFVTNSRVFQVAEYLSQNNLNDLRLIGYDLLPGNVSFLKEGVIDFLISQRPEEQGYMGIITLFNYLFMEKEVEKEQFIPIDIITRENIDYYKFR